MFSLLAPMEKVLGEINMNYRKVLLPVKPGTFMASEQEQRQHWLTWLTWLTEAALVMTDFLYPVALSFLIWLIKNCWGLERWLSG